MLIHIYLIVESKFSKTFDRVSSGKMSVVSNQRPIGSQGLQASSLGYGAMGLTAFYGPPSEDEYSVGNLNYIDNSNDKCYSDHIGF